MRTVVLSEATKKDILENLLKRSPNSYGKYEPALQRYLQMSKKRAMKQYSNTQKSSTEPKLMPII